MAPSFVILASDIVKYPSGEREADTFISLKSSIIEPSVEEELIVIWYVESFATTVITPFETPNSLKRVSSVAAENTVSVDEVCNSLLS